MECTETSHGRHPSWTAVAFVLGLLSSDTARAEAVVESLTNVRGANFTLPGAGNPVEQWLEYDAGVVESSLTTLEAFGVNGVRVFGSFDIWKHEPSQYVSDLTHLAMHAFEREMLLMLVLFDSYGAEPTGDVYADALSSSWVKSPGQVGLSNPQFAPQSDQYVVETLAAVQAARDLLGIGAAGQVVYDIWNEPAADGATDGQPNAYLALLAEIDRLIQSIKAFTDERTTVGFAWVEENQTLLEVMEFPEQLDIISHHPYGIFEAVVHREVAIAKAIGGGRPIVATEAVLHGAFQDCAHVLQWLSNAGEGFFFWEAFASETPFAFMDGLFYADPSGPSETKVRDLEGVNKLLMLGVQQGFEPTKLAVLKSPSEPGFMPYGPVPYAFTSPMAHDLLLHWESRYGVVHPPISEPGGQSLAFHELLINWALVSLSKLSLLSPEVVEQVVTLQLAAQVAEAAGDLTGVEAVLEALVAIVRPIIVENNLAEPLNTPPEVVYLRIDPNPFPGGGLLTVDLLVNDADRNSDLVGAALFIVQPWMPVHPLVDQGNGHHQFTLGGLGALSGADLLFVGGGMDLSGEIGIAFQALASEAP